MFRRLNIRIKLIIFITLLLLSTMIFIGVVFSEESKKELMKSISEKLHVINDLKIEKINGHLNKVNSCFNQVEKFNKTSAVKHVNEFLRYADHKDDSIRLAAYNHVPIINQRFSSLQEAYSFQRIIILDLEGKFLYSTDGVTTKSQEDSLLFESTNPFFTRAMEGISYSDVYRAKRKTSRRKDDYYMAVMRPLKGHINNVIGLLAVETSMEPIYESINDTTGLGKSGETIVTKSIGDSVQFLSPPRYWNGDFLQMRLPIQSDSITAAAFSTTKEDHGWATNISDYKGEIVDVASSYMPGLNWGIYTKINHKESFASIEYLKRIIVSLCSGIIFFSIIIITIFVQRFLTPIMKIRNNIVSLANGRFPNKISYSNQDEIQDTTTALNNLVERLQRSTDFAQRIGKGDLEAEFTSTESQDVLSSSLLAMRNSLARIEEDNEKRKWVTEGIAMHSEVLRKNSENIKKLGVSLISSLVKYMGANQGAFYAINQQTTNTLEQGFDTSRSYYELVGTYAYEEIDEEKESFLPGQGLVGQCALEGETIYLKNAPGQFTKISSGLGEEAANYILIVPLKVNEDVLGVVEIASFAEFEPYKVEFAEKLGESIASSILAVKSTEKARELLTESERITSELKQREEELKENQTRMEKEQEKLRVAYDRVKQELEAIKNPPGDNA